MTNNEAIQAPTTGEDEVAGAAPRVENPSRQNGLYGPESVRGYHPFGNPPFFMGLDVSTKFIAFGVINSDDELVGWGWNELKTKYDYSAAADAARWLKSVLEFQEILPYGYTPKTYARIAIEEVPFMGQNRKTAHQMNRVISASAASLANIFGSECVVPVNNVQWMPKVIGYRKGVTKDDIRKWCHERWTSLDPIPSKWTKTISRGPRKGVVEEGINDVYDALAIAEWARLTYNGY